MITMIPDLFAILTTKCEKPTRGVCVLSRGIDLILSDFFKTGKSHPTLDPHFYRYKKIVDRNYNLSFVANLAVKELCAIINELNVL